MAGIMGACVYRDKRIIAAMSLRATLCGAKDVRALVKKKCEHLSPRWLKEGITVLVKINLTSRGVPSALSMFGNTTYWGWQSRDKFHCP